MKTLRVRWFAFVVCFTVSLIPEVGRGGQPISPPGKTVEQPVAPDFQLQPIFTRLAQTSTKITLNTTFRASRGVELQEADHVNSQGVDAELVVPFLKRFQLRIHVPICTEGDARLLPIPYVNKKLVTKTQPMDRVHFSGNSGVFDFASAYLEYQILTEEKSGLNLSVSGGIAERLDWLQTDNKISRKYDHSGHYYEVQLRGDKRVNDWLTVVGNLGFRHYFISDDLNPAGNEDGDVFSFYEAYLAGVFHPWNNNLYPVLEVVYNGDGGNYNSVLVAPELIWAVNSHLELKAAVPFSLTTDGESIGVRVQATARF